MLTKRLKDGLEEADKATRIRERQPSQRESETMNVVVTRSDVLLIMQQFHKQQLRRMNMVLGSAIDDPSASSVVGLTEDALAASNGAAR